MKEEKFLFATISNDETKVENAGHVTSQLPSGTQTFQEVFLVMFCFFFFFSKMEVGRRSHRYVDTF